MNSAGMGFTTIMESFDDPTAGYRPPSCPATVICSLTSQFVCSRVLSNIFVPSLPVPLELSSLMVSNLRCSRITSF